MSGIYGQEWPEAPELDPWGEPDLDAETEREIAFNRAVHDEAHRIRVRRAAQERVRAESEPEGEPFDLATLAEHLARPGEPPMRVDGLVPSSASVLLSAKRKAGKTTFVLNYVRALLDGGDFLGRFPVRPMDAGRRAAVLNFEVSGTTFARWASEAGIDPDRLVVVNLRGRRNPLTDPTDRGRLALALRALDVELVVVDPFGRAYAGKSQNDAGEVGAWLVNLDTFVRSEVGAADLVLAAHAGWDGERTRGSSALEDWADVIVTLTTDEEGAHRYLKALGRDVEVEEDRLEYDPTTRALTMTGAGSRRKAKDEDKLAALAVLVQRAVSDSPGLGGAELVKAIRGMEDAPAFRDRDVTHAARWAAERGFLRIEAGGPGRKSRHFLADPSTPSNPVHTTSTDVPLTPSTPSLYGRGGGRGSLDTPPCPSEDPEDDEARCSACRRRLGRAETDVGACLPCQRIAARSAAS